MKRNVNIEYEILKTLESASNFKRHPGNPFLFTRIEAKLNSEHQQIHFRKVLKPIIISAIIFINIFTIYTSSSSDNISREEVLSSLAQEYSLVNEQTIYDELNW